MASVFFRGPKASPRWFARFKGVDGRWISRRVRQENRRDALRVAVALEARAERQRLGLEAPEQAGQLVGPLMRKWGASLTNRSRDVDIGRIDKHLVPHWKSVRVTEIDLPRIMQWIDQLAEARELGPGSQRHCLGLLSRFLSWATERGFVPRNPVRDIPPGRRPRAIPPRPEATPWIRDDETALAVMRALGSPLAQAWYLGNRSGLRLGEVLGLRLGDMDELAAGAIRVAHSYDGPLKEDRHDGGKVKWAPAALDATAVLAPLLERRRAAGAGPEDRVFVDEDGDPFDRHQIAYRWRAVRSALGLPGRMTWYQATRHSFASRALASGAGVDEIAAAMGHSSPATTARHYLHHVRKRFSPILCAGLGLDLGAPGAKVIALSPPAAPAENADEASGPAKPGKADDHAA